MAKRNAALEPIGPFHGFSPSIFTFFDALSEHQSRDWFLAHKAEYEKCVRTPLSSLITSLSVAFAAHEIPLTGDGNRSLFRINRDVRFAKDKRPYKTNASAVLSRDGTKDAKGVLYFHVGGPEREVFVAAGFYGPEPDDLALLRTALVQKPQRALKLEETLAESDLTLSRDGALVRLPKGYESFASEPVAEMLKLKHLIVRRSVSVDRLYGSELVDDIVAFAQDALPLLDFGWSALVRRAGS